LFPMVFCFDDGSRVLFAGAALPECQRLINDLAAQTEQGVEVVKGNIQRLSALAIKIPANWKESASGHL